MSRCDSEHCREVLKMLGCARVSHLLFKTFQGHFNPFCRESVFAATHVWLTSVSICWGTGQAKIVLGEGKAEAVKLLS